MDERDAVTRRWISLGNVPAETQPDGCGCSGSTGHRPILVPSDGTRNLSNMCSPDHIPMEAPEKSASLLELERQICELAAHIAVATCRWLLLLAEFDSRDGWAECGLKSCAHWLSWKCSIAPGVAREKVRVAHRLQELPLVREAFSRGELSYCKVRALTRAATPETEEGLLEIARHATGAQLEKLMRCYSSALSATLGSAQRQQELRYLRWSWNEDGSLRVEGRLPADDGALLINALSGVEEQCAEGDDVCGLAGRRASCRCIGDVGQGRRPRRRRAGARGPRGCRDAHDGRGGGALGAGRWADNSCGDGASAGLRCGRCPDRRAGRSSADGGPADADDPAGDASGAPKPGRRLPLPGVYAQPISARTPHPALGAGRPDNAGEPGAAVLVPPSPRARGRIQGRAVRPRGGEFQAAGWASDRAGARLRLGLGRVAGRAAPGARRDR